MTSGGRDVTGWRWGLRTTGPTNRDLRGLINDRGGKVFVGRKESRPIRGTSLGGRRNARNLDPRREGNFVRVLRGGGFSKRTSFN